MGKNVVVGLFVGVAAFLVLVVGFSGFDLGDGITGHALDAGDSSGVSRSFSGNGLDEDIIVTISVLIDSGYSHDVYVVEETVPGAFTIVNSGSATVLGNTLRWSALDNVDGVTSTDLDYTIRTSQVGTYPFSGTYGIDGMDSDESISGSSLVIDGGEEDNTAPIFAFTADLPLNYSPTFDAWVNVLWSDDVGVVERVFESNFGGSLVNISGSSWSGVLDAGSYQWRSYARDAAGNWGITPLHTFEIAKGDADLVLSLNGEENDIETGRGESVNIYASADVEFGIFEDGVEISNGLRVYNQIGTYDIGANTSESANYFGSDITRQITVVESGDGISVHWNHSKWLSGTTNFSSVNLSNFSGRFVNGFGEIQFLRNLSILRNLNLSSRVEIENGIIFVDSSYLPEFNFGAELRFNGLTFIDPRVLKDGIVCSTCIEKSYAGGLLIIEVDSFSEYYVEEGYVAPDDGSSGGGGGSSSSGTSPVANLSTGPVYYGVPETCVEEYSCGEWGECIDGSVSRICSDSAGCNVDKMEMKSCGNIGASIVENTWIWVWIVILGFLASFVIIISVASKKKYSRIKTVSNADGAKKVQSYVKKIEGVDKALPRLDKTE